MRIFKKIANVNGNVYVVDPDSVFAVAADLLPDRKPATRVYGMWDQPQILAGPPGDILKELGTADQFVKFSNSVGELWIRPGNVGSFHAPFPGDGKVEPFRCLIMVEGYTIKVLEDPKIVQQRLEAPPAHA